MIGSFLHRLAYPEAWRAHQQRGGALGESYRHATGGEVRSLQLRGEYLFAAKGPVKDASSLDPHRLLGNILSVLALLLLIAVIVARPSRRVVITVIVLFVLTAVEGFVAMAGSGSPYVGALSVPPRLGAWSVVSWGCGLGKSAAP